MKNKSKQVSSILRSGLLKPVQLGAVAILCGTLLFSCSASENENTAGTEVESGLAHQAPEAPVEDDGKGIGPVKTVELGADIDQALASEGKSIFEGKCSACHQLSDQKIVGPGLAGVTEIRKPEWVMNMIINPEEMTKKDPTAKKLLAEHLTQMTNQNVNEQDARAILEFLRQNDKSI
ncbi:mono/diheme cytochrome c family protein [Pontibacter aydingkolensis]|uniref:Cytochrome c n=1 Tax=Pontibacter aydingkolensis TaxID=1911536 RepID=A0ABS7CWM5_9BACT|nr:cytochrome c [Pontibacter aydingkolensis]MBW7468180.1 cytochrome c [Pontibacter aydingkolensis]